MSSTAESPSSSAPSHASVRSQRAAAALLPEAARRHLHERRVERDRLREHARVGVRPARRERRGQLGARLRAGGEQLVPGRDHVGDVDAGAAGA